MRRLVSSARVRFGIWLPLTGLMLVLGIAASVLGAQSLASSEAKNARQRFRFSSEEIASSLKLAISNEEDLVANTSAHVVTTPDARTPLGLDRWIETAEIMRRFPEIQNIGFDELVPASQLAAFQARRHADPLRPFGSHGPPAWEAGVVPNENASFYCLAVAGMARGSQSYVPLGLNYCALAPTMMYDRDAGAANYAPVTIGGKTSLGVAIPVYRTGTPPTTVAARRRAFVGWLGELLVPNVVLERALEGHPNIAVKFGFSSPAAHFAFYSGHTQAGASSDTLVVHRTASAGATWILHTYTPVASGSLFGNPNALYRLVGGLLLTLLATSLILVLGTGRRRALAMVAAKTAELAFQATHDPLTRLPNRALVQDRATQLIAGRTRAGGMTGALFIDIDGFKEVNDTMGHAAGDELLRTVADRLQATVREQDTVGRLSGDEFVVLFEHNPDESCETLAERINEAVREPILVSGEPVLVTASIGIACGRYGTADELLRDADLALYQAKGQGKDRHAVFSASAEQAPVTA
ncbi:MAG TPA: sensor domain-containing diguanylate cyclase [Solirubrobacteraceae bacterium]|nr:sensor domain-containing diguanylate cyclase [Solirubrobacteraceae bacterium]